MPIVSGNVTTVATAVYTSSGNNAITYMSITNYSAGNIIANVYAVPSGDTPGNLNVILSNLEITSLDTYQLYAASEKLLLNNNDSIQVNASANSAVSTTTSYTSL
jgi:hypothetical protein